MTASVAINALAGGAQYSIDSAFHNDFDWGGFAFSVGFSALGAFVSGPGMTNTVSIDKYLDATGKAAKKAISTAFARYGYSSAYKATVNLWSSRLSHSLINSYIKSVSVSFRNSLIVDVFSSIISWINYLTESQG